MAKLLVETKFNEIEPSIETNKETKEKLYYIEGIFLQANTPNRNNRIYPLDILSREVDRYIKESIEPKYLSSCGELNHPSCFHEQTQALTVDNGWKYIKDCVEGELIYTFNINTNMIEIKPINKIHISKYTGLMHEITGRNFYTKVTPNHKFLLASRSNQKRLESSENILDGYKTRKLSHDKIVTIDPNSELINDISTIFIEGREYDKNNFFAFMGIYLSEGCFTFNKDGGYYNIQISQNAGWKADKIRLILNSLHPDLKWKEYTRLNEFNNIHINFKLTDKSLSKYLSKFGKSYEKYIDVDLLKIADTNSARLFLESFILGDGRGELGVKYSQVDAFTTSKQLRDDISQLAFIAGYSTSFHEENHPDRFIGERLISSENTRTLYFCNFKSTSGKYIDNRFLNIIEVPWDDYVYCLTVENSTFYARDGNNTFWTGNSEPSVNPDRISHRNLTLRLEGKNFIGKAKILNTTCGKQVKILMDEGLKLGVSSRAVGSLMEQEDHFLVQDDLRLSTVDIVSEPSVSEAIVENIMESKEWEYIDGHYVEITRNRIRSAVGKKNLEEAKLSALKDFLSNIKIRI